MVIRLGKWLLEVPRLKPLVLYDRYGTPEGVP